MEIPAFAKSLPFLVGTGTVGVGGVGAAAAWGVGAFGGSSQSEAGPGQQKIATDTRIVSDTASDVMQNMKYMGHVWETLFKDMNQSVEGTFNHLKSTKKGSYSGNPSKWNDLFDLVNYGCTKKHLVGKIPHNKHDGIPQYGVSTSDPESNTKLKVSSPASESEHFMGCATIGWKSGDKHLIFKSEVVIRNDKYGMAFWTGIKSAEPASGSKTSFSIVHYAAFYERQIIKGQKGWVVKGGYGWGGQKHKVSADSISIQLPWETNVRTLNSSTSETKAVHGEWKAGNKKDKLMELSSDWYSAQGNVMTFSPLKIKMGQKAHSFLNTEKLWEYEYEWHWKRYCTEGKECWGEEKGVNERYELDVKDQIDAWFKQFKDQEGTWASSENPYEPPQTKH